MTRFEGILTAAVTPSRADSYQMDLAAALEVVDFLNEHQSRGIVLFGATGEFPHFSMEERMRFANMAIKRSRVPVVVNATHSCFDYAEQIAEDAVSHGAAGILIQPPHYFRYSPEDIRQFLLEFVEEVGTTVPVLLYNLPAFNNAIPAKVAGELLLEGRYAGIKDSSGDPNYFAELMHIKSQRDFNLIIGHDGMFVRGRSEGADGVISGCACAVPELLLGLDEAILAKDDTRIVTLTARLTEFMNWISLFPGPQAIRDALTVRGLKMGVRSVPYAPETQRRAEEFMEWFRDWLPVVRREAGRG